MADPWEPTGPWKRAFRQALDGAFDEPSIGLLIVDYFAPKTFPKISAPGYGKTFEFRLQELIDEARMNDWLLDLVAAARERRPKNLAIRQIAEDLGLTAAGPRLDNPTGKPLEALIQENAKFINPAVFSERLPQLESQVCWIEIPGGNGGTGFLVGPDQVLTNHHVIEPVVAQQVNWQDVRCRFDHLQASDGTSLDSKKQVRVPLHPGKWLIDSMPPSEHDWDPTLGDAKPEEADYALLQLAEKIGDQPVGGATTDDQALARLWVTASGDVPPLAAGNQVFLLQHPEGKHLQLTIGTVKQFNAAGTRVRYDANSKRGSSGSPCFDADLRLVALHHAHDPKEPPAWNQAIPFALIQKLWHDRGIVVP